MALSLKPPIIFHQKTCPFCEKRNHLKLGMDTEEDYTVAKSIVQSGQLDEEWDSIRQGKGIWPVEMETWKQFRAYSMQELKDEMKRYSQSRGNTNFHAFHKISFKVFC